MKKQSAIKSLRLKLGLSTADLAEAIGVTNVAIYYLESQQRKPSRKTAYKLIDFAASKGVRVTLEEVYPR